MPRVTGLRSPHAKVGRIVVFGRMLDKIRLHARDALPPDYHANLGESRLQLFDARCCRFLGVDYTSLRERALQGGCDEEILRWAHENGTARSDEECVVWNSFMTKIGWRDDRSGALRERAAEYGLAGRRPETFCELIDLDEGRPAGATCSWEPHPLSLVVVMGVSGCGKTTVGQALAGALGWEFRDSDALHPATNVSKMSAGIPLDDSDRAPWLAAIRAGIEPPAPPAPNALHPATNVSKMSAGIPLDDSDRAPWLAAIRADIESRAARGAKAVVACSALKEAFRSALTPDPAHSRYVHLREDFALIRGRLSGRIGHYMGESLLRP